MPKRIPIAAARHVASQYDCRQVILLAFDGDGRTHVVTYGKSTEDCAQAAAGGNMLKQKWGWPECNDQPSRVKRLEVAMQELINAGETVREQLKDLVGCCLMILDQECLNQVFDQETVDDPIEKWLDAVAGARSLQRANAVPPQATNETTAERQQKGAEE